MLALIFLVWAFGISVADSAHDSLSHDLLDRVLQSFVDENGLVAYKDLKARPDDLTSYVALLALYSPENAPEKFGSAEDRLAYWLNAYNAQVLLSVVEAYPVKSVRDIKWFYGFFNRIGHRVGGREYTLKHIENEIIRKRFPDPRIHAALNCASMGCPKLPQTAYRGATLEHDLDAHMRIFLREPRNVRIDRQANQIFLSDILRTFQADFTPGYPHGDRVVNPTILDYLKLFVAQSDIDFLGSHPDIKIIYLKYDWRLNGQGASR